MEKNIIMLLFVSILFLSCGKSLDKDERIQFKNLILNNNTSELRSFIINNYIDLNDENEIGLLPIVFASNNGKISTVKLLLELGADINKKNSQGYTALMVAKDEELIRYLLEHGAKTEIKNLFGSTALHLSVSQKNQKKTELLIRYGANVNAENKQRETMPSPLHHAIVNMNYHAVELLIDSGAEYNKYQNESTTLLHYCVKNGKDSKIIGLLLREGVGFVKKNSPLPSLGFNNVKINGKENWEGRLEILNFLLKNGQSINSTDKHGNTILHIAAKTKNYELIKRIKHYNPDPTMKNDNGQTVFDIAQEYYGKEDEQYLREILK